MPEALMRCAGARVILAILSAILAASCSTAESASPPATAARGGRRGGEGGAVPIETARVEQKPMPVTVAAVGTAEAISTVEIRSQVTGPLSQVNFSEGDEVHAGQLLFTLDTQ